MTTLNRVRVALTGFPGAPGVNTFYFLDVATAIESLNRFYTSIQSFMPNDVHVNVQRAGDTIEDTTGALTGSWLGGVTNPIVMGSTAVYAGPAGIMVGWETGVVADGHRVRGRTFLVPGASNIYDVDGTILTSALAPLQAAATQLVLEQSSSFVIWHRPRLARVATATRKALSAHAGSHALVTTSRVPDKVVVLRSRRD